MSDDFYGFDDPDFAIAPPVHGWRCWHCDEVFADRNSARLHFGSTPSEEPGCIRQVSDGDLGLLRALRKAEAELARYRVEDSDKDREISRLIADHAAALRQEEERGYGRGVREGMSEAMRTLATALHKFAPDLSLELTGRWNVANGEAEAALQEFLTFLRSADGSDGR